MSSSIVSSNKTHVALPSVYNIIYLGYHYSIGLNVHVPLSAVCETLLLREKGSVLYVCLCVSVFNVSLKPRYNRNYTKGLERHKLTIHYNSTWKSRSLCVCYINTSIHYMVGIEHPPPPRCDFHQLFCEYQCMIVGRRYNK